MLKYTICFIKKDDEILMLNRESPSWMGRWNGVGGKIEPGETSLECILREVREETGIQLTEAVYKGNVTWEVDGTYIGGMYAYIAELPKTYDYPTPIKRDEGILDWKKIEWILDPENVGMANVKYFLPKMLTDGNTYNHRFVYENNEVIEFSLMPLGEKVSMELG